MYTENQYDYDSFQEITSCCDICGLRLSYHAGMTENSPDLCDECSNKMFMMDDGIIKDSISKFAVGNVI